MVREGCSEEVTIKAGRVRSSQVQEEWGGKEPVEEWKVGQGGWRAVAVKQSFR